MIKKIAITVALFVGLFQSFNFINTTADAKAKSKSATVDIKVIQNKNPYASVTPDYKAWLAASKGKVTPQEFGAKGDGITDDSQAINQAIAHAIANNKICYFPKGCYIISPRIIRPTLKEGENLFLMGCGVETVLKRKTNSLDNKWDMLIRIRAAADNKKDTGNVVITGISIDSNRREQANATMDHRFEAAHDISIGGLAKPVYEKPGSKKASSYAAVSFIPNVVMDNIHIKDSVADGINFYGYRSCVKKAFLNNIISVDRKGMRNDVDFPGYIEEDAYISNVKAKRVHIEHNYKKLTAANYPHYHFANIDTEQFTVVGGFKITADKLFCRKYLVLGRAVGTISNSHFVLTERPRLSYCINTEDVIFDKCTFTALKSTGYSTHAGINSDYTYLYLRRNSNTSFKNCTFELEKGSRANNSATHILYKEPMLNSNIKLKIDSCSFLSGLKDDNLN